MAETWNKRSSHPPSPTRESVPGRRQCCCRCDLWLSKLSPKTAFLLLLYYYRFLFVLVYSFFCLYALWLCCYHTAYPTSRPSVWNSFLLCVWQVRVCTSARSRTILKGVSWFTSVPPGTCRDIHNTGQEHFQILSNSLSIPSADGL
jgi:hypothetical protein